VVGPLEKGLHVKFEMVSIDVEAQHRIDMANESQSVDRDRDLHGSQMWNLW
jgi:hypothetical protein